MMQVTISFEKPAHMKSGGLAKKAEEVRQAGRNGDEILVHVNEDELNFLKQHFGPGTVNPATGLPQFNLLDFLLPAAANVLLPGVGGAIGTGIGSLLGLGADSVIAPMLGSALVGGGISALTGGDALTGALAGGLSQPLLASLGAGQTSGVLSGLNLMGSPSASAAAGYSGPKGVPATGLNDAAQAAASNVQQASTASSLMKAAPLLLAASALGGSSGAAETKPPESKANKQGLIPVDFSREQTNPKIDYYSYGYGPEQMFFKDNALPSTKEKEKMTAATGRYVKGGGTGTSDSIPAQLSDGEYVIDAQTVSMLGDGSSDAGAAKLDAMRENIRKHKGSALAKGKFAPNAKSPLSYVKGA